MNGSSNSAGDGEEIILPPLKKHGLPLFLFRLIRVVFTFFSFDVCSLFPILLILIIAVIGLIVYLATWQIHGIVGCAVAGAVAFAIIMLWLSWARNFPAVPDEKDVARIPVCGSSIDEWPRAPNAPIRGELVAAGGSWFRDSDGRRLLLRGINLAATKLPSSPPKQRVTYLQDDQFYSKGSRGVSFVGRPFPLEEQDLHLGRLRAAGYTCLRFLITWEAVEHDGPGIYDEDYLAYLKAVVERCGDLGICVFIDTHQDVWSRWTGGDGAPSWTLEKVGFALEKLDAAGAAVTEQYSTAAATDYPEMVWNSNNARIAAGTMWTLFFAGNDFAPKTLIDGKEPVQDYLQRHFFAALGKVAEALRDCKNVIGFDILNEPSVGFVGVQDMRDVGPNVFFLGWRVDTWSAIKLGAGETCSVDYFSKPMWIDGKRELNTNKVCAWEKGPNSCVWHENGVWKMDPVSKRPTLLKPNYFASNPRTGNEIDFLKDYGIPFYLAAAKSIRAHIPDAIIFIEPILDMTDPSLLQKPVLNATDVGAGFVWAPHYYDFVSLMSKTFCKYAGMDAVSQKPSVGSNAIAKSYGAGIASLKHEASEMGPGGCPILIGECGIQFDMGLDKGSKTSSFFSKGQFSRTANDAIYDSNKCTNALNRTMEALDHARVSYTLWCYQAENTNEHGDGWNGEDLSLFSLDHGGDDDLFSGGRALLAAIRPYPCRVAGDVVRFSFAVYSKDRRFELVFKTDHGLDTKSTVVFLPRYQYPHGVEISIPSGGGSYDVNWDTQTLTYTHTDESSINHIVVTKAIAPPL